MNTPHTSLRSLFPLLAGLTLLASLLLPVRSALALGATSTELPLYFLRSADCTGEVVEVSGTLHLVSQTQMDGSVIGHFNYADVTGVGLSSGSQYRANSVDHVRLSAASDVHSIRSFRLINLGAGSNLLVSVTYHITVNATGELTVSIDDLRTQCT